MNVNTHIVNSESLICCWQASDPHQVQSVVTYSLLQLEGWVQFKTRKLA